MEYLYTYLTVLGAVATIVIAILAFRGYLRGLFPPKFIVGILPSKEERLAKNINYVVSSKSMHEEKFHSKYLAKKKVCNRKMTSLIEDLLRDKDRCRHIPTGKGDVIELPVIVQNVGNKQADWYTFIITFDTLSVGVIDIKTEYLKVDTLFVHDETCLTSRLLRRNAPEEIRQAFADLRLPPEDVPLSHDFICFSGILEAKTYEMVYLKLKILEDIDQFFICFRIDCPAWIAKTQVWLQPVRVKKE